MSRIKYTPPMGTPIFSEVFTVTNDFLTGNNTYVLPGTQLISSVGNMAILPISTIFCNSTNGRISDLQFGTTTIQLSESFIVNAGESFNAIYYNLLGGAPPYGVWNSLSEAYQLYWSGYNGTSGNLKGIFYYGKLPLTIFQP